VNSANPIKGPTKQVEQISTVTVTIGAHRWIACTISFTLVTLRRTYTDSKSGRRRSAITLRCKDAGNEQMPSEVVKNPNGVGYGRHGGLFESRWYQAMPSMPQCPQAKSWCSA